MNTRLLALYKKSSAFYGVLTLGVYFACVGVAVVIITTIPTAFLFALWAGWALFTKSGWPLVPPDEIDAQRKAEMILRDAGYSLIAPDDNYVESSNRTPNPTA
jgi:hypothetical protein